MHMYVCIRWEPRELEVSSQWGRKLDSCASYVVYQPKGAKLTGRAAYCDAVGRLPCDILIFARQSCVMSPHKPCVILKVWLVSWSLAHFMTAFLEELHYVLYDIYIGTNIQKFHMIVDFWPNFILNPHTCQKPNSKPQFKY